MGSVLDTIECPHCERDATSDFYYKTGEEYIFCGNCGYNYRAEYKRNEDGELVTKDGTDNHSFDNLILETKEIKNPYGAYTIKHYGSKAMQVGTLENEDQYYDESEGNQNTPGDGKWQKGDGIFNRDEQMKYKKILEK